MVEGSSKPLSNLGTATEGGFEDRARKRRLVSMLFGPWQEGVEGGHDGGTRNPSEAPDGCGPGGAVNPSSRTPSMTMARASG